MSQASPLVRSAPLAAVGAILGVLALAALAHEGLRRDEPAPPLPAVEARASPEPEPPSAQTDALLAHRALDLNRASAADLELLPRIGPTLAARIVEERARGGRFERVSDLARVRGVGPRTVARLAPLVTVGAPDGASP